MIRAIRFGVLLGVRHAAHQLSDYWAQTMYQSNTKGKAGPEGRAACARHVAVYTAINVGAVLLTNRLFDLKLTRRGIAAGELVSVLTHYTADRREHGALYAAADALEAATGKASYLTSGGAPDLDQAWHHSFNALAAAVAAAID